MSENKRNFGVFATTMSIVGAIIGAGFASGAEIVSFFGKSGWLVVGVGAVMFALFFVEIFLFLNCNTNGSNDFGKMLLGGRGKIFDYVLLFCHFCVLSGMIAGARSLCILAGMDWLFLVLFCVVGILLFFGFGSVVKINAFLLPLLCIFLIVLPSIVIAKHGIYLSFPKAKMVPRIFLNLLLYVSMNSLIASPILLKISGEIKHKKTCAFVSSAVVCALFLIVFFALSSLKTKSDLPFFDLCKNYGFWAKLICVVFLLVATLSTLVSCGMALVDVIKTKNRAVAVLVVFISASFASLIGFSNIVLYVYPFMGILGALIIAFLLLKNLVGKIQKRKKQRNSLEKTQNFVVK